MLRLTRQKTGRHGCCMLGMFIVWRLS
jgi:hypothetical protein